MLSDYHWYVKHAIYFKIIFSCALIVFNSSVKIWTIVYFLGTKFIVVADPKQTGMENLLKKIYELYADYAMKNPFYSLEMPIR